MKQRKMEPTPDPVTVELTRINTEYQRAINEAEVVKHWANVARAAILGASLVLVAIVGGLTAYHVTYLNKGYTKQAQDVRVEGPAFPPTRLQTVESR